MAAERPNSHPIPLVPLGILADGRVIYSDANYLHQSNPHGPRAAASQPSINDPGLQSRVHAPCQPEAANECKLLDCTECVPPEVPEKVEANPARMEAEQWVARILGLDLDYLRTLPPAELQEKINIALEQAQKGTSANKCNCASCLAGNDTSAAHAPAEDDNRREMEDWLERTLKIPHDVLHARSIEQLDALVKAALVEFQPYHE